MRARRLTTAAAAVDAMMESSLRLRATLTAAAILVAGCLAETPLPPPPSRPSVPSGSPSASPAPSKAPASEPIRTTDATPVPSAPAALERIASVEQDGVRVTIELERNPMPAGEPTWVTNTITNTGRDAVVYVPCGEIVNVGGAIADLPWHPGRDLPAPAQGRKSYLLDHQGLRTADRYVIFLAAGQTGSASGCGDVARVQLLAPGVTIRERARWDGLAFRQLAPPPTAQLDLVGTFEFDRGDPLAEHPPEDRRTLDVHLETWIAGLPDAYLDPAEAADIALTDPRLTAVLASRDLRNGNEGVLRFDPRTDSYQVGMLESGGLPVSRAHLVLVNARTGDIVGFVVRDWDYAVDGYP